MTSKKESQWITFVILIKYIVTDCFLKQRLMSYENFYLTVQISITYRSFRFWSVLAGSFN